MASLITWNASWLRSALSSKRKRFGNRFVDIWSNNCFSVFTEITDQEQAMRLSIDRKIEFHTISKCKICFLIFYVMALLSDTTDPLWFWKWWVLLWSILCKEAWKATENTWSVSPLRSKTPPRQVKLVCLINITRVIISVLWFTSSLLVANTNHVTPPTSFKQCIA